MPATIPGSSRGTGMTTETRSYRNARGQLIEFMLRLRGFQMALENAQHLVSMTAARCEPPLFRSAELLQMHIADAALIKSGGELAFREPRPPRCRHRTHVDQEPDPRLRQRIEKGAGG